MTGSLVVQSLELIIKLLGIPGERESRLKQPKEHSRNFRDEKHHCAFLVLNSGSSIPAWGLATAFPLSPQCMLPLDQCVSTQL